MEFRGNDEQTAYDSLTFKSGGNVFTTMKLIALDIAREWSLLYMHVTFLLNFSIVNP